MKKTFQIQWVRSIAEGERSAPRIRYRRGGERWSEAASLDELPDDLRDVYQRFRNQPTADLEAVHLNGAAEQTSSPGSPRRRRRRRRHRAREIDRTLTLEHVWFSGWLLVCLSIAAGYAAWLAVSELDSGGWRTFGSVLLLLFAAVMAYYACCVLVNSTEFRVDDENLSVRHGPLPWFGNRDLPVDRVRQISTRVRSSRYSLTYSLSAHMSDRLPVQLAEGIETASEARSIERAIERHLGIEDWN